MYWDYVSPLVSMLISLMLNWVKSKFGNTYPILLQVRKLINYNLLLFNLKSKRYTSISLLKINHCIIILVVNMLTDTVTVTCIYNCCSLNGPLRPSGNKFSCMDWYFSYPWKQSLLEGRVPLVFYNQRLHFSPKDNMQTANTTSNNFRKQTLA